MALSTLELKFLTYAQTKGLQKIVIGELRELFNLSAQQERKLLSRLSQRGWIVRVRRGLYLLPPQLSISGAWNPSEALALTTMVEDLHAQYQISGPNAFHRYGWDSQVPNRIYVYNDCLSGDRSIGSLAFTWIKVAKDRLGGTEFVEYPDGTKLFYSTKARSLLDAVYDWSRFNTLPRAYNWVCAELRRDESVAASLVNVTLRYGNQGTIRRIGKLLELENASPILLKKLKRAVNPAKSFIPWVPSLPKQGEYDRNWGVVMNYELPSK